MLPFMNVSRHRHALQRHELVSVQLALTLSAPKHARANDARALPDPFTLPLEGRVDVVDRLARLVRQLLREEECRLLLPLR